MTPASIQHQANLCDCRHCQLEHVEVYGDDVEGNTVALALSNSLLCAVSWRGALWSITGYTRLVITVDNLSV